MPHRPGVYLIKDKYGSIIYIGKAKNLHNRLRSHFTPSNEFSKSQVIREKGVDIEIIEVQNEGEAFLLEFNLIQEHQPILNTQWKDGKTYPLIEITGSETFPRVLITRETKNKGSFYLGPFPDVKSLRRTLKLGLQLFPVADCDNEIHLGDDKTWAKTCMRRRTKSCLRPCEIPVNPEEYKEELQHLVNLLEGKIPDVKKQIERKMKMAAENLKFEMAARYRDILKSLDKTLQKQHVVVDIPNSFILCSAEVEDLFGFNLLKIHEGRVIQQTPVFTGIDDLQQDYGLEANQLDEVKRDFILDGVIRMFGANWDHLESKRIINSTPYLEIEERLAFIGFNVRSAKKKESSVVLLAEQNLKNQMKRHKVMGYRKSVSDFYSNRIHDLQKMLGLEHPPLTIDFFDVSTLQGSNTVASCVRFVNAKPYKKGYRRFKIKSVSGQDDFASMKEAVYRRYEGGKESEDKFGLSFPNLIVIDGGEIQLAKAIEALESLKRSLPVVGLAKKEEQIYLPNSKEPLSFEKNRPGMLLLREGRDEAHRFAVTYHRKRREITGLKGVLDNISGIGEKRRKMLLREYKTVSNIAKESSETLAEKFKIPRPVASEVILKCRRFVDDLEAREARRKRFTRTKAN